jgi:FKBP-type peptidyl-prolyl cis-trans isomerase FkpA
MSVYSRALHALWLLAGILLAAAAAAAEPGAGPTRVEVIEHAVGTGKPIARGAFAVLRYTAWLYDPEAPGHKGQQYASSESRGEPLTFVYGLKRALPGLEKGLAGMRVGGRRTIVIPSKLAYDGLKYPRPAEVPVGSALVFDVELIEVVPQGAPPDE